MKLFVFGTLKRGFALHDRGLSSARFLGPARAAEPRPLLVAGPWFAPMMLDRPGEGRRVRGELYEIDASCLAHLDALESVGIPGNFRILIDVETCPGGEVLSAFVYVKAPELAVPVHSGYLDDYQDLRFVPPEERP